MHRLLKRQLRKFIKETDENGLSEDFIEAVSLAYEQTDADRKLIERSLDLTSKESLERFQSLQKQLHSVEKIKNKLEISIQQLKTTMDAGFDGIVLTDRQGNPLSFNKIALDMVGLSEEDFRKLDYKSFSHYILTQLKHPELFLAKVNQLFNSGAHSKSVMLEMVNGKFFDVKASKVYQDNKATGMVWTVRDITELKRREQDARYKANHDQLTDLANRTLFLSCLDIAISKAERNNKQLAVLFLDLDNFKYINDTFGHPFGDKILVLTAKRLNNILRDSDLSARFSGDEFVLLLEDVSSKDDILPLLARLQHALSIPYEISDKNASGKTYVTSSIGIAMFPSDAGDAESLISKADMAMYDAKRNGRDTYKFYSPELEKYSKRRLSMHNELRVALENNNFELVYQPKVELGGESIVGAEALIRWNKNGREISPNDFIQAAESNGMIMQIDRWVIMRACHDIGQWIMQGVKPVPISINISPVHFQHGNVLQELITYCDLNQVPPETIIIEITEGSFIGDIKSALEKIEQINAAGFKVSIDDFGTGYSSFTYLSSLPVKELKIDRSFIVQMTESANQLALVKSIIDMAHVFNLTVVAEGVENKKVVNILKKINCDQVQGFYFHKPAPFLTLTNKLLNPIQNSLQNSALIQI